MYSLSVINRPYTVLFCFIIIGKVLPILFLFISIDTMFKQSAGDNLLKCFKLFYGDGYYLQLCIIFVKMYYPVSGFS